MRMTILLLAALAYAQEKPARLTFEVASIKPYQPEGGALEFRGIKPKAAGQGYDVRRSTVKLMISLMYKVSMAKISGGPAWLDSDLWTIEAKADKTYSLDDLHTMFQNLLADEFKLKFHKEIKQGPVYVLTVDKAGSKMKVNDSPQDFEIPIGGGRGGVINGKRVPMQYLAYFLGQLPGNEDRPVIDKTGLKGNYDFTLSFMPELPPGFKAEPARKADLPLEFQDRPSLFDALRDQLGLRLEAQKGPVEYYVIDSVEKPAGN